jgi:hypothetical protein
LYFVVACHDRQEFVVVVGCWTLDSRAGDEQNLFWGDYGLKSFGGIHHETRGSHHHSGVFITRHHTSKLFITGHHISGVFITRREVFITIRGYSSRVITRHDEVSTIHLGSHYDIQNGRYV